MARASSNDDDQRHAAVFAAAGAGTTESRQSFAAREEVAGLWDTDPRIRDLDADGLAAEHRHAGERGRADP